MELPRRTSLLLAAAGVTLALCGGAATAAVAPKPLAGEWIGTNRTEFTVSADHKRIQLFSNRCGPATVAVAKIKILAGGRFTLDQRISEQTGKKLRVRVSGRFTSAADAQGTVTSSRCKAKFVARSRAAPEPEPAPDPLAPD